MLRGASYVLGTQPTPARRTALHAVLQRHPAPDGADVKLRRVGLLRWRTARAVGARRTRRVLRPSYYR